MANRYHRTPARPPFLAVVLNYLAYLFLFAVCTAMLFLAWPTIEAQLRGQTLPLAQPTARIVPQAAPVLSLPQIEATSVVIYQATAQAVEMQPNINTTGDGAPLERESMPVDRQPAGENVPTAEPIMQGESDGMFGSKRVVVNPQETKTCLHGQVWTDSGCHNPTPVGGG